MIGGFTAPRGRRVGLGALVLGVYEGDELVYIGHTGGGLDTRGLADLTRPADRPRDRRRARSGRGRRRTPRSGGSSPSWCARSRSRSGRPTGGCGSPSSSACGRTSRPARSAGRCRPPAADGTAGRQDPTNRSAGAATPVGRRPRQARRPDGPALTNLDKVYWPDDGYTKGDLIAYYRDVAPVILPYLRDRPHVPAPAPGRDRRRELLPEGRGPAPAAAVGADGARPERVPRRDDHLRRVRRRADAAVPGQPRVHRAEPVERPGRDARTGRTAWSSTWTRRPSRSPGWSRRPWPSARCWTGPGRRACARRRASGGCTSSSRSGPSTTTTRPGSSPSWSPTLVHRRLPGLHEPGAEPGQAAAAGVPRLPAEPPGADAGRPVLGPAGRRGDRCPRPLKWAEVRRGLDPARFTIQTMAKRLDKVGDLWGPVLGPGRRPGRRARAA